MRQHHHPFPSCLKGSLIGDCTTGSRILAVLPFDSLSYRAHLVIPFILLLRELRAKKYMSPEMSP